MFYYGLGFLLGNLALYAIHSIEQAGITLILSLMALFTARRYLQMQRFVAFVLAGVVWSSLNILVWKTQSQTVITQPKVVHLTGFICSIPYQQQQSWRFDFCLQKIDNLPLGYLSNKRVRVNWGKYAIVPPRQPKAGQHWQLQVKIRPIHGRLNPSSFDYERWLVAEGFIATAAVKHEAMIVNQSGLVNGLDSGFHRWRQKVFERLNKQLPDGNQKSFMNALLMGERSSISDQQWQDLQGSGTSHLLAISGLHVGIASLWSYWIVLFLWRLSAGLCRIVPAQRIAEVASILGALLVVLLSGLGLPAQRALIMLLIFILSRWSGLHLKLSSVLGLAVIFILIKEPFAVLSISFWLSFSAVFVISVVLGRRYKERNNWLDWLKVNWYLYLAMLPIGAWFFNQISWVALLANLILIPLTSFITTPLLYLGGLFLLLNESLASILFWLADRCLWFTSWVQQLLASINLDGSLISFSPIIVGLLFLMVGIALLPAKSISKSPVIVIITICVLTAFTSKPRNKFEMWVFDVGQGLAIYLETSNGSLLYDTGWGNDEFAIAESTVLPFLQQKQITQLDMLILSHGDADHAGGLGQLIDRINVKTLVSGEPLMGYQTQNCHKMAAWQWGQVDFKFVEHTNGVAYRDNNSSCVLSVQVNQNKLLLTGDIEKAAENRLLKNGLGQHHLVIAPHHGSKTSSTRPFVERVNPGHVVFSSGFDNQWNFPKPTVVERYQSIGSLIWITSRDGAIRVTLAEEQRLKLDSMRDEKPRFWR